jgi:hypothetical protein
MYLLADTDLTGLFFAVAGVGMVVVLSGGAYLTTKLIIRAIREGQQARLDAQARENTDRLKALMIQRGWSADEIERVLNAQGELPDLPDLDRERRYGEAAHHI